MTSYYNALQSQQRKANNSFKSLSKDLIAKLNDDHKIKIHEIDMLYNQKKYELANEYKKNQILLNNLEFEFLNKLRKFLKNNLKNLIREKKKLKEMKKKTGIADCYKLKGLYNLSDDEQKSN